MYALDYHVFSQRSQEASYLAELAAAQEQWPAPTATASATADLGPDAVAAGEAIYQANCVACHGPDLHGGIGPNLVDDTWIHGSSFVEIRDTIQTGVPDKGMITWGPILGPEKVGQVAAYIYTRAPKDGG